MPYHLFPLLKPRHSFTWAEIEQRWQINFTVVCIEHQGCYSVDFLVFILHPALSIFFLFSFVLVANGAHHWFVRKVIVS